VAETLADLQNTLNSWRSFGVYRSLYRPMRHFFAGRCDGKVGVPRPGLTKPPNRRIAPISAEPKNLRNQWCIDDHMRRNGVIANCVYPRVPGA